MKKFSELDISSDMADNFTALNYEYMTPVQEKSIPVILKGSDVIVQARTGSGKTAAFGTGILCSVDPKIWRVQALVLCPTRELADQVTRELRRIAKFRDNIKMLALCGGLPMNFQEVSLSHQAHIIIGTPGRIERHLQKGNLDLSNLRIAVLDEADRMLEVGFLENIENILSHAPAKYQKLFFSATFPEQIKQLARKYLKSPVEIAVDLHHDSESVIHRFIDVNRSDRHGLLASVLSSEKPETAIVFCNTKAQCIETASYLKSRGFSAFEIHGDIEQKDRTEVMVKFANRSMSVLVATDVAARGIDINGLDAVINFDMPFEPEVFVHRSGRTARAGKSGKVFSFLVPGEQFRLDRINEITGQNYEAEKFQAEGVSDSGCIPAPMVTFSVNGGRKSKISPGHILGALTGDKGISASEVGKIDCFDLFSYVAVSRKAADRAEDILKNSRIKGKKFIIKRHP